MLAFLVVACGPDLPVGWEDAEPVASLVQHECDGTPYEPYDVTLDADLSGSPVSAAVHNAHFRCAQDVEGFWQWSGDALQILVQPSDMNPRIVAGCDCLYDLDITVEADGTPTSLEVWERQDALNDPNEPERVATQPSP
ncbi:MAG: hypothetical protein KC656_04410 [Myxococcales bacterium]|nr:hypothetical protein [Myxococcales bacterium]MCB9670514.1 hypothetical protein [Alphaproteobacteria bacterium]MCB9691993.1 hypothetical protein [Alphaproteobacteria bacterium]